MTLFLFLLNTTITVQYKIYAKLLSFVFIFDVYAKKIIYDAKNYFSVNYQKKLRAYCFPKFGIEFTRYRFPKRSPCLLLGVNKIFANENKNYTIDS